MIYLLTPTGGRQAGLIYLARYIKEQTYQEPLVWIVVDDCDPRSLIPKMPEHVTLFGMRPGWRWNGANTQAKCLQFGLEKVPDEATVIIMEDDDVYLPGHVENVLHHLEEFELVGEKVARYYNIASERYRTIPSNRHASLAATAMRGDALKKFRTVCATATKGIDFKLWQGFKGPKKLLDTENVIGIKGMPGRAGIGVGHRGNFGEVDKQDILGAWIGRNRARFYDQFRRV